MKVNFDIVSIKAIYRWKEDGKKRQQTRTFWQSVNPFNKNANGTVKTREQIMNELIEERRQWQEYQTKLVRAKEYGTGNA